MRKLTVILSAALLVIAVGLITLAMWKPMHTSGQSV